MKKKVLSIVLVMTMLVGMIPFGLFSAFAAVDPATCEHTYEKHYCTKCGRTEEIYGHDEYKARWVEGYDINGNRIYISKFYNASSRPVIFSNPEYILRDTKDPNDEKAFELTDFRKIWPIEVVAEQPDAVIDYIEIKVVGFWGDEKWTNGYKEPIGNVDILSVDKGTIEESGQIKGGEIIHIKDVNSRELTISWDNTLGQFPDHTWPLAFGEYTVHYKGIVHDYKGETRDNGDGTHSIQCTKCDKWSDPTPHTMEDGICTICGHAHDFEYIIDYSAGTHTAKCKNCPETQGPVSHSYVNHYCVCGDREYYTTSELFRVDDIYRYENGEDPMCYKQTHFKVKVFDDFLHNVLWIGVDEEPETITISSIDPSEKIQRVEFNVKMCEGDVKDIITTSGEILEEGIYTDEWKTIHLNNVNASSVTLSSPGDFYAVGDIKVFSAEEHQFTNILKDNGDGTHSIKCIGCDETNGVAVAHNFNNGVCACGASQHTHDYDVSFTFAEDGKSATANISCKVDGCTFTDTKNATVTSEKTKNETCHSMGETTYKASYTIGGTTYTDTKTVADVAMSGHDYDVTFTFAENGKTATANISCKADGCTFTDTKNATVTSEKTKNETCHSMGETTYTASYTIGETNFSDTKTVADVDMSDHDYDVEIYFACDINGNEVAFAYITCKTPGCTFSDEKEATITSEITKQPTFDAKGETTYTGSYTFKGTTYTNTETLKNIPMLVYADYTAVDAAIAAAEALDSALYTPASWSNLETAINAVVTGLDSSKQAQVDAMATAINTAISALTYKDADYSAVETAKANIPSDLSIYTDATVAAVNAAVNAVVEGKNITEQAAVDAMAAAINTAVAGLALKDADYSAVNEAIAKADALNEEDYTAETWEALETALDAVVTGKKITAQAEVDAMAKAIEDAIAALKFKEVVKESKIEIAAEEDVPNFEAVTDEGIKVEGNFVAATEDEPAGFLVSGDGTDDAGEKKLTFTAPEGWVIVGVNFDVVYVKSNDRDTHECDIKVTGHDADVLSMDSANLHFEKSFLNSVPAPAPKMAPGMVKAAPKALPSYGVLEATIEVDTYNAKCLLNNAEVILARIGENVDLLPTATESAFAIIELAKENAKSEAAKAVVVPEDAFAEATTVAEVNAIMETYLAKIALEEYKFEAIKEINALLTENSTEEEKALVASAIEAIMAATSIEEVDAAKADFYTKWNAPHEEEDPDGDCPKIVTGFCFTYRANKDVPVIGAFIKVIHKLIHIFHKIGDSTHLIDR